MGHDDRVNERSDRRLVLLAAALAGLSTLCCAAALVAFELVGVADSPGPLPDEYILGTVWPIVGALIVRGQPRNPVGWLMLISASTGPYLLAGLYAAETGGAGVLGATLAWYAVWGFAPPYFFTLPAPAALLPRRQAAVAAMEAVWSSSGVDGRHDHDPGPDGLSGRGRPGARGGRTRSVSRPWRGRST